MAIEFQYNKTSLQDMRKQLKVRENALPTLKNKESALRIEVKRAKDTATELDSKFNGIIEKYNKVTALFCEFDAELLAIEDVKLHVKKIAGVKTPVLDEVVFKAEKFSVFSNPAWFLDGMELVKELVEVAIEREFFVRKMALLDFARKKTTQKVNLYEKVQIPGYEDAILKIKRFMEDEENLSKSAQKIVKNKLAAMEA